MRRLALLTVLTALAAAAGSVSSSVEAATCTAEQQAAARSALTAYRTAMKRQKQAYFRRHRSPTQRAAFTRAQQAKLRRLGAAAGCTVPAEPPVSPCLRLAPNEAAERNGSRYGTPFLNEGGVDGDAALAAHGVRRVVLLAVDFPDMPADEDAAMLGRAHAAGAPWFSEASYGRMSLEITVVPHWFRMPKPASAYVDFNQLDVRLGVLADVVATADPEIDFSKYDAVYVLVPRAFHQGENPSISVFPGRGAKADGVEVRHMTVITGGIRNGIQEPWVPNHEFMHMLGIMDVYYETDQVNHVAAFDAVGAWDPMSSPGPRHLLAWHKWLLGWLDEGQLACTDKPGTVEQTLTPLELSGGAKAIVVRTGPSTATVVEVRQPVGYDQGICRGGVLVYTVDSQVGNAQKSVVVARAREDGDRTWQCGLLYDAPYEAGEVYDANGVRVDVLSAENGAYRVRATLR